MKRPPLKELLLNNVYFDTCVYHQPGIDCMTKVIPSDNILFASEMVGAVKGIDPETGHYFDDTRRYIDGSTILSAADKKKIFECDRPPPLSLRSGPPLSTISTTVGAEMQKGRLTRPFCSSPGLDLLRCS